MWFPLHQVLADGTPLRELQTLLLSVLLSLPIVVLIGILAAYAEVGIVSLKAQGVNHSPAPNQGQDAAKSSLMVQT